MSRARLYRTEAVVLRRHDYGEADRILTLLTPDRGKVRVMAKGVRRLTSRAGSHVELFHRISVVLAQGRNLEVLNQAETLWAPRRIREELLRTTYAYHLAELADRLTGDDAGASRLYGLVRDGLVVLEDCPDPALLARFFELRALEALGYRPELFRCVECTIETEPEGNAYHPADGGVLCPDCAPAHPGARPLASGVYRVLRFLQTRDWPSVEALEISPATALGVEEILVWTLENVLERQVRSVEFLANLRAVVDPSLEEARPTPPPPRRD